MKFHLIFLNLLVFSSYSIAQTPYYDAIALSEHIDTVISGEVHLKGNPEVYEILARYASPGETVGQIEIVQTFKPNPFLEVGISDSLAHKSRGRGQQNFLSDKQSFAAVSGLNVTKPVQALSSVLIERAKQEINVAFFQQLKAFVEKHAEFQVMFPSTTQIITQLVSYQYPQMLPALQSSFHEDLLVLPNNLDNILILPKYREFVKLHPQVLIGFEAIRIVRKLESGEAHPAEVIIQFAEMPFWNDSTVNTRYDNLHSSVKLSKIFSESLRESTDSAAWISPKQFKELTINNRGKIYWGLIYRQAEYDSISFHNVKRKTIETNDFSYLISQNKDYLFLFENQILSFLENAQRFEKTRSEIKETRGFNANNKNDLNYTYISSAISLIEASLTITKFFHNEYAGTEYLTILRNAGELYRNLYNEQYAAVVVNSIGLISSSLYMLNSDDEAIEDLQNVLPKIQRYGLFIANMAQAKTPEEIKSTIDAAVLPVGSSSVKKYSAWNLSLQSHIGGYYTAGRKPQETGSWGDKIGIIAPVGISLNTGLGDAGSIGVNFSLIDIGAIVDYDLKRDTVNNNVSKSYEIKLGQIVSPGLYLVYGFPVLRNMNLPLSLGFGAQYGPGLGRVESNGAIITDNPSWRYNAFLGLDIPLLHFYNAPRNYVGRNIKYK